MAGTARGGGEILASPGDSVVKNWAAAPAAKSRLGRPIRRAWVGPLWQKPSPRRADNTASDERWLIEGNARREAESRNDDRLVAESFALDCLKAELRRSERFSDADMAPVVAVG